MKTSVLQIRDELADREAIKECLYRYCRGTDRCDMDILRTAYWPGAMDYHTGFTGTIEEFIAWAEPRLKAMSRNFHMLGNILMKMDGDKAYVETYFWAISILPEGPVREIIACGRYLDRMEKRNNEWRIAERTVIHDWFQENAKTGDWNIGPFGMSGLPVGKASRDDQSYSKLGLAL